MDERFVVFTYCHNDTYLHKFLNKPLSILAELIESDSNSLNRELFSTRYYPFLPYRANVYLKISLSTLESGIRFTVNRRLSLNSIQAKIKDGTCFFQNMWLEIIGIDDWDLKSCSI